MDIFAVIGLFFGMTMILIGQAMEGGNLGQLLQITAAFIVLGGTTGAVILSFPHKTLISAIKMLKNVFMPPKSAVSQPKPEKKVLFLLKKKLITLRTAS